MQPGERSQLVLATDKFGQQLWVYDKDLIGMTILGGEFWDGPLLLPFYDRFAKPGTWAIEIGAFFGQGAIYLAKKGAGVLAAEPLYPDMVDRNVRLNQVDEKVLVVACPAYSHTVAMSLAPDDAQGQDVKVDRDQIGNLGGVALVPEPGQGQVFCGHPLDDIVRDWTQPVCLIKVDAQGCDLRALMGLHETIKKWHPPILFEWEAHLAKLHGDTWEGVLALFANFARHDVRYTLQSQAPRGYDNCWVAVPEGVEYPNA